ncbi:TPA: hypothetical protein ACH3X3_007057 [Trebouxia sp. C0006]
MQELDDLTGSPMIEAAGTGASFASGAFQTGSTPSGGVLKADSLLQHPLGPSGIEPPIPEAVAAQSGAPLKQSFTAVGSTAAAADLPHGQATLFGAASGVAPKLPNSPGQNRPQVAVVPLHQAAST